ncbi:MAG: hypothetical protein ACK4GN_12840 [Runella sp.]
MTILLTEASGRIIRQFDNNNLWIYALMRPVTLGLVAEAFNVELRTSWIRPLVFLFWGFHLINLVFFQKFGQAYDSYSSTLALILNTIWCLYYLYRIFDKPTVDSLFDFPLFWPICGYLVFNASTLIVFATISLTNNPVFKEAFPIFNIIKTIASHFLYLTFLICFFKKNNANPFEINGHGR